MRSAKPTLLRSSGYVDVCQGRYADTGRMLGMAPVGGAKTIYVREADADVWQKAEQYARARRLSMSALVLTALEAYLGEDEAR
jgi:hypothetical protein